MIPIGLSFPHSLSDIILLKIHSIVLNMEFFSILTKISMYNYTVSIIGSVIGLRHDISDYNEERKGKEPQHENVRLTMK